MDNVIEISHVEKTGISESGIEIYYRKVLAPLDKYRQQREKEGDYSQSNFTSRSAEKIGTFWKLCLQRIDDLAEYKFVVIETDPLLEEAKGIRKELIKRIEEPWKI